MGILLIDFVIFSYVTFILGDIIGNLAAIRTFRVLRAIKTVAVVPGTCISQLPSIVYMSYKVAFETLFQIYNHGR